MHALAENLDELTTPRPKTRRKSLARFSLRVLLLFIAVAAVVMAYISHQLRQEIPLGIWWDVKTGENVKWSAPLGTQSYSNPTVHDKFVFIGSNNGAGYDPLLPSTVDLGVMLCFEKATGKFLWQHSNQKLKTGRAQDWPLQGVCSQAFADGDRLWYVSNRCEVVCLDTLGFRDKENDGPYVDEVDSRDIDADVVWKVDMISEFGVYPHNMSHCNVVVDKHRVYVKTSNGVDEAHINMAAPDAPSFVVLDRETGRTIWTDNKNEKNIFHGGWGSPRLATINGKEQILVPGGDGWLYSYEPAGDGQGNAVLLWQFDGNPKTSSFQPGGRGDRNQMLTAPTVHLDRVYFTLGQDPEHGAGQSRVWCIEPGNRRGDISPTIVQRGEGSTSPSREHEFRHCVIEAGDVEVPNPNSALVWEYTGNDANQNGVFEKSEVQMSRSLSEVRIAGNLAFVADLYGHVHCLDAETGKFYWAYDTLVWMWNSPLLANGHVFLFNEEGLASVLKADKNPNIAMPGGKPISQIEMPQSIYANPAVEQGVLYIPSRSELYAIEDPGKPNRIQKLFR